MIAVTAVIAANAAIAASIAAIANVVAAVALAANALSCSKSRTFLIAVLDQFLEL